MEDITDADYKHVKRASKIKNLCEYHDLYVQRDTVLLADVFEECRNMCVIISAIDLFHPLDWHHKHP